jgi:hypothetical protein
VLRKPLTARNCTQVHKNVAFSIEEDDQCYTSESETVQHDGHQRFDAADDEEELEEVQVCIFII